MKAESISFHCARFDHGGCGLRIVMSGEEGMRIEPDRDDVFSRGWACPKGLAALDRLKDPRRLTHPLKRRGPRGSDQWERIEWDEALDLIASTIRKMVDKFGPEALAFAQGSPKGPEFFLLIRLANLLHTPNVAVPQHVCHMPREQMALVTCGFFPVPDFEGDPQCVVVWGSNPLATNEEGVLGGHLIRCLQKRPVLIVVDPVDTALARRADIWLRIRPGTDDYLGLGLLNVIVREGLHDEPFVAKWTVGFQRLKEHLAPYTPEYVGQKTWLHPEDIARAARLYAQKRPSILHWGNALEHTSNSAAACRTLVILMAVTGNLEVPGGNIRAQAPRLKRLRELIALDDFPDRSSKLLNRYHGIHPRLIGVPNWMVIRSILDQSPYPIRFLYTQGTNPLVTYAETPSVQKALKSLDFLVVADQVMTPTAALADVVLPVALPLEYDDIGHYGLPHGVIMARPKVFEPRDQCRPDLWILNELGKRLGFRDRFWNDPEEILDEILAPSGLTYQQLCDRGVLQGTRSFRRYVDQGFRTPSGKVELYSSLLQKWGFDPLPVPSNPPTLTDGFPLLLTSRKPRLYFHSAYRHLNSLRNKHPHPRVLIHPETAEKLGISEGQEVRIESQHGTIVQKAAFRSSLEPRVVVADFGWWFPERETDPLRGAFDSNINVLTSAEERTDPVMGTSQLRAIPCRIIPLELASE